MGGKPKPALNTLSPTPYGQAIIGRTGVQNLGIVICAVYTPHILADKNKALTIGFASRFCLQKKLGLPADLILVSQIA